MTVPEYIPRFDTNNHVSFDIVIHPVSILSQTRVFACDCGIRTVIVTEMPHRCCDCGEWWFRYEEKLENKGDINETSCRTRG